MYIDIGIYIIYLSFYLSFVCFISCRLRKILKFWLTNEKHLLRFSFCKISFPIECFWEWKFRHILSVFAFSADIESKMILCEMISVNAKNLFVFSNLFMMQKEENWKPQKLFHAKINITVSNLFKVVEFTDKSVHYCKSMRGIVLIIKNLFRGFFGRDWINCCGC